MCIYLVLPLIPKFLRAKKVRKIGSNLGFGSMPAKSGRFWKNVRGKWGCLVHLRIYLDLFGKLGVLHPNILSPVRWTAIYEVWDAWTNNISEIRRTEFEKRIVFGIMFGPHFVNLSFFNLHSFAQFCACLRACCAFLLARYMPQSKKLRKNKNAHFATPSLLAPRIPTQTITNTQHSWSKGHPKKNRTGHCGSAQIAAFPVQRSNSIWRNRTKLNSIPLCCSLAECTMS